MSAPTSVFTRGLPVGTLLLIDAGSGIGIGRLGHEYDMGTMFRFY
jgi:hypothetical protein